MGPRSEDRGSRLAPNSLPTPAFPTPVARATPPATLPTSLVSLTHTRNACPPYPYSTREARSGVFRLKRQLSKSFAFILIANAVFVTSPLAPPSHSPRPLPTNAALAFSRRPGTRRARRNGPSPGRGARASASSSGRADDRRSSEPNNGPRPDDTPAPPPPP